MAIEKIKVNFLKDTEDFHIRSIEEVGIVRNIRFGSMDGGSAHHFNLTTWPGYLAISGDMGCFVFRRVEDMFDFFRSDEELKINPDYWHEKITSTGGRRSAKSFYKDKLLSSCREIFESYSESFELSEDQKSELWEEMQSVFSDCRSQRDVTHAAMGFDMHGFQFDYESIPDGMDYSYHFIWCLFAIVWGIQQYDAHKKKEAENE